MILKFRANTFNLKFISKMVTMIKTTKILYPIYKKNGKANNFEIKSNSSSSTNLIIFVCDFLFVATPLRKGIGGSSRKTGRLCE